MKTAIITGASSGLGREFARQLTDVFPEIECCWLIARREDRLEEIAREMVGVETVCLPLDLCDSMSFTTLQEKQMCIRDSCSGVLLLSGDLRRGLCAAAVDDAPVRLDVEGAVDVYKRQVLRATGFSGILPERRMAPMR